MRDEASWKESRSPLATSAEPPARSSEATAAARKSSASYPAGLGVRKPKGGDKLRQDVQLPNQIIIELSPALIGETQLSVLSQMTCPSLQHRNNLHLHYHC